MVTILIILLALFTKALLGEEHFHIVPVNSTSLCQHYPNGTCFTLDTFSSQMGNTEKRNITLSFLPGEHLLTQGITFNDMYSITLINEPESNISPRISCVENKGLKINNTDTFVLQGLVLYGCISKGPVIGVQDVGTFYTQDCKFIEHYNLWEECIYGGMIYILRTSAFIRNTNYTNNKNKNMATTCDVQISSILNVLDSKIEIDSCRFDNNTAEFNRNSKGPYGSAISLIGTTGCITNTTFASNLAEGVGGALTMLGSTVNITDSSFNNNQAKDFGGAIAMLESTGYITSTEFVNNQAKEFGGAIAMVDKSKGYIINATFVSNQAVKYGGAIMGLTESIANITNTRFVNNDAGTSGGAIQFVVDGTYFGIYLTISKCMFYNNSALRSGGAITARKTKILIRDNTKYLTEFKSSGNVYKGNHVLFGEHVPYGGGAVFSSLSTLFENDLFMKNSAAYGAAIVLSGPFISMNMSNCSFTDHKQKRKSDFSIFVGFQISAIITNITMANNSIQALLVILSDLTFHGHTRFTNNTWAHNYGGILLASSSILTFSELSVTKITGNTADFGGGLYLNKSKLYGYGDMLIVDNIAMNSGGGIYATKSIILFQSTSNVHCKTNHVKILNNTAQKDGGGIYLSDTTVNIQNSGITLSDNHAEQFGGGISFADNSKINVKCNHGFLIHSYLYFKRNSALKGGGVHVSDKTNAQQFCFSSNEQPCFLLNEICSNKNPYNCNNYSKYTHFENNTAVVTGSDIYGGMLDTCKTTLEYYYTTGIVYMRHNVSWNWASNTIQNKTEFFNHISSDPVKLCFCVDNIVDCTFTPSTVHKKKGETFTLSIVAVDQVEKPVNASLFSSLNQNGGSGRLKAGQQYRTLPNQCTKLEYNVYFSRNEVVLELYPEGPCGNQGLSKREVSITFDHCTCPLGFEQQHDPIDCSCDCTEALKPYIKQCWQDEGTFQLNDNNWIQSINNTGFIVHDCPFDYCQNKTLNISLSESSDIQCAFNRTGILCGKCTKGLSMVFASSQCQPCSNYYLFLLIPIGLAGMVLVLIIMLLNMTVATGTIHGLIFYANILTANRSVFLPFSTANFLTVFVSWLNFDMGIETCFFNGMDSYGKVMLQLVFPAYVFFLIVCIIVLCDHSQRIARLFGKKNPEATLYTLLLLSYTNIFRTIITDLQFTTLNYPDGSKEIVWLYDPNVRYFALNHIPRFLVAFIITILGAIYISLLLFGQLFNRCSEYRLMKWTSHKYYIHFMKAHHAPLSDNHRYWVGLLLLARLSHCLISAFTNKQTVVLSVLITSLSILVHKAIFNSYAKKSLNLLENFFIANLSVFAGVTLYVQVYDGDQQALAIVSMSFSFIAFLGLVLYHIIDSCGVKLSTKILQMFTKRRDIDYRPVAIIESEDENASDESDEELIDLSNVPEDTATIEPSDPTHYITPPVIRSVFPPDQLREPALDDLCPLTPADYNFQPATPQTRHNHVPTFTEISVRT